MPFKYELEVNRPALAFITESWLDDSICDGEVLPDSNYSLFRRDRNRHGDGVLAAVANHLYPIRISEFEHPDLELLWLEISTVSGKLLLGCVYRPPNSCTKFFEDYQSVLDRVLPYSHNYLAITIVGDFNVDFRQKHPISGLYNRLLSISDILSLHQMVGSVTRPNSGAGPEGSIIDLVFCNSADMIDNIFTVPGLGHSDHNGVFFSSIHCICINQN